MSHLTESQDALTAASAPANGAVKITSGAIPVCRALWVGTAGTATIVCRDGTTATDFPLKAGLVPLRATTVTLGTASDVWALY